MLLMLEYEPLRLVGYKRGEEVMEYKFRLYLSN